MELAKIRFYQLQKQNLIVKAQPNDYSALFKKHIGLHSTDYLTPYLSLWARIENFNPLFLFDDLNTHRQALRLRAFRGTVFVVHKDNLNTVLSSSQIFLSHRMEEITKFGLKTGIDFKAIEEDFISILSGNRLMTLSEIKKELRDKYKNDHLQIAIRYLDLNRITTRTRQKHITDRLTNYGLLNEWMPDLTHDKTHAEKALEDLVLKYIMIFGPVCLDDLCWWFPVKKTPAKKILENLKEKLTFFSFNEKEYFIENNDYKRLMDFTIPDEKEPVVNFLPYEDHYPKAYTIRNWYLPEETLPLVYQVRKIEHGQIRPTIWLNGEIIGRWELDWIEKTKTAMKVEIVALNEKQPIPARIMDLIEKQRKNLEDFINEKLVLLMRSSEN